MIVNDVYYEELTDEFCSNFDGIINYDVVEMLKTSNICAEFTAWDWFGRVYYYDGLFFCEVWRYGDKIGLVQASTPEELVELCQENYGRD